MNIVKIFFKALGFVFVGFLLSFSLNVYAGTLTNVSVTSDNYLAGATATYTFSYTIETANPTYILYTFFGNGFDTSGVVPSDVSATANGESISVSYTGVEWSTNRLLVSLSSPVPSGANIVLSVANIVNPSSGAVYTFQTFFKTSDGAGWTVDDYLPLPNIFILNEVTGIADIIGTTRVGSLLRAGALTPSYATVNYQWKRSSTVDGEYEDISGATSSTYTLTNDDLGKYIKVLVTGNSLYGGTLTSNPTSVIGEMINPFTVGDGLSAETAYHIENCTQLQSISSNGGIYLDKYFILEPEGGNTIDCGITNPNDDNFDIEGLWADEYGFSPIGDENNPFVGYFDGNGKTIDGLFITRNDTDHIGLFGYINKGENEDTGIIKNLNLTNFDIHGGSNIGGLVGKMLVGTSLSGISISGDIYGSSNVGGLVGYSDGSISDSTANISVESNNNYIGGLVGYLNGTENNHASISESSSEGNITGFIGTGGLVGLTGIYGDIENSHSSVNANSWLKAGGLVGVAQGTIENSYATGVINITGYGAGGLVGYLKGGTINQSYATGNIHGGSNNVAIDQNSSYAGGLVGLANLGKIYQSYATGNVVGESIRVGGLVGGTNALVQNCYSTGDAEGDDRVGGLVGGLGSSGEIINSYSTGKVTVVGISGGETPEEDGGGGGGGYWGGQGGQSDATPGGGGSGYLSPSVSDGQLLTGNDGVDSSPALPPETDDESYIEGVGVGGTADVESGNGKVVINYGATTEEFIYTGSDQNFVVPSEVTNINVKIWGAGGGGGTYNADHQGGSGGYADGTLSVTPEQNLLVVVGGGGGTGTDYGDGGIGGYGGGGYGTKGDASGGGGGGLSGIFNVTFTQENALIIAGGGGGGTGYYGAGGAGGGTEGSDGGGGVNAGCGGTATAGGGDEEICSENGDHGEALQGGNGDVNGVRTSEIVESEYYGGLVGFNEGEISSSYWDIEVSEEIESNGGIGKNTTEMQKEDTFENWDFNEIWNTRTNNYPCLQWQESCVAPNPIPEPTPVHRSSGSSALSRYSNLLAMGKIKEANEVKNEFLNNQISYNTSSIFIFTKNLKYKMIDDEVKELQKFLNTHGYIISTTGLGSTGNETTKFGLLTKKAVIKFQFANNLKGDGVVGPLTRKVINSY